MSDLKLTCIIAPDRLTCFQCFNHGLSPDGIEKGETCVEILGKDGRISFVCEDCFERLNLEIVALAEEEQTSVDNNENETEE